MATKKKVPVDAYGQEVVDGIVYVPNEGFAGEDDHGTVLVYGTNARLLGSHPSVKRWSGYWRQDGSVPVPSQLPHVDHSVKRPTPPSPGEARVQCNTAHEVQHDGRTWRIESGMFLSADDPLVKLSPGNFSDVAPSERGERWAS